MKTALPFTAFAGLVSKPAEAHSEQVPRPAPAPIPYVVGDRFRVGHGVTYEVLRVYPVEVKIRITAPNHSPRTTAVLRSTFETDLSRGTAGGTTRKLAAGEV